MIMALKFIACIFVLVAIHSLGSVTHTVFLVEFESLLYTIFFRMSMTVFLGCAFCLLVYILQNFTINLIEWLDS